MTSYTCCQGESGCLGCSISKVSCNATFNRIIERITLSKFNDQHLFMGLFSHELVQFVIAHYEWHELVQFVMLITNGIVKYFHK